MYVCTFVCMYVCLSVNVSMWGPMFACFHLQVCMYIHVYLYQLEFFEMKYLAPIFIENLVNSDDLYSYSTHFVFVCMVVSRMLIRSCACAWFRCFFHTSVYLLPGLVEEQMERVAFDVWEKDAVRRRLCKCSLASGIHARTWKKPQLSGPCNERCLQSLPPSLSLSFLPFSHLFRHFQKFIWFWIQELKKGGVKGLENSLLAIM